MPDDPISIKRYPNRRYYARNTSKYVSLQEIEDLVQAGETVEIRDSQTGDNLTRAVLTQIIMERHPEKMTLFPIDMLHVILRSNDAMSGFLHDYFRHSLAYLDYLQRHSTAATALVQPMHWLKAWLSSIPPGNAESASASEPAPLNERVEQLEERLKELEAKEQ